MNKTVLITISLLILLSFKAHAEVVKDSDHDGLSDDAEVKIYRTNLLSADTDGDGYSDLFEIQRGFNPNDPAPLSDGLLPDTDTIFWYLSRIFGIASFLSLTAVIVMGLTQTSKILIKFKVMGIPIALQTHKLLSYLSVSSLAVHVSSLFFDQYVHLNFLDAFIPLRLNRDLRSALGLDLQIPVGLGIISLYLLILLVFTSVTRGKLVSMKLWRSLHYLSFLLYATFIAHGFLSGTDTTQPWMLAIYSSSLILVLFFSGLRVFRKQIALRR